MRDTRKHSMTALTIDPRRSLLELLDHILRVDPETDIAAIHLLQGHTDFRQHTVCISTSLVLYEKR